MLHRKRWGKDEPCVLRCRRFEPYRVDGRPRRQDSATCVVSCVASLWSKVVRGRVVPKNRYNTQKLFICTPAWYEDDVDDVLRGGDAVGVKFLVLHHHSMERLGIMYHKYSPLPGRRGQPVVNSIRIGTYCHQPVDQRHRAVCLRVLRPKFPGLPDSCFSDI